MISKFFKKKQVISFILMFSILVCLGCIFYYIKNSPQDSVLISDEKFYIEKVSTREDLILGLGDRDKICKKCAMMFNFSNKSEHLIWMKGMRFPLDILWVEEGKIVWIEKNISKDSKEIMGKGFYSDSVIELNAGTVDRYKINIGDKIVL